MGFRSAMRRLVVKAFFGDSAVVMPRFVSGPRRGSREILEAYRTSPWHRAVENRLADECASAALKCLRLYSGPDDDDGRELIKRGDSRYLMLDVLRRPTVLANGQKATARQRYKLLKLWLSHLGEAGLAKQRGPAVGGKPGLPAGFVPINPYWVKRLPTPEDPRYHLAVEGKYFHLFASEMLWFKEPDPLNPFARGVGCAEASSDEIDTDDALAKMLKASFLNWNMPDGMLVIEGARQPELDALEEQFNESYKGPEKRGRVHFAGGSGKSTFHRFDNSFKDNAVPAIRKDLRDSTMQTRAVSPEIFGVLDSSSRDSIDSAIYHMHLGVTVPFLDLLVDVLQADLVPDFREDVWFGYRSPIPDNRDLQLRAIATAPSGFRVRDVREVGGFLPDPECGDERLSEEAIQAGPTNVPPGRAAPAGREAAFERELRRLKGRVEDLETEH